MIALSIVLAMNIIAGIGLVVVGWMALTRKLPPNQLAGIRTPYTFSSTEAWYETHEAGGPILLLGSVAMVAVGLALLPFTVADMLPAGVVIAGILAQAAIALAAAVGSWLYGVRKAKAKLEGAQPSAPGNGAPNASREGSER